MKKSKKKSKGKKGTDKREDTKELTKFEVMEIIDQLKSSQYSCMVEEDFEKAMQYANQIMEYAIRYKLSFYIKEQDDFLKNIAMKVQKRFYTSQIEKECLIVNEKYDNLIESNEIEQAHENLEYFKEKYAENSIFGTLPFVRALIEKDRRIWIKYISVPK